jgi:hypothetical protein
MASGSAPRSRLIDLSGGDPRAEFVRDVATGLTARPKRLGPGVPRCRQSKGH